MQTCQTELFKIIIRICNFIWAYNIILKQVKQLITKEDKRKFSAEKAPEFTWTFDEVELLFFGKPLSISNSAKKFEDFGGDTWLITWGPSEQVSAGMLSTYSKREEDETCGGLELDNEVTTGTGSSGFWS